MDTVNDQDWYEERLERMVNLYQLPLLRLCYAFLHDEEMAKDAVQETFIKAYRNMDRFRETASEKTCLSRIAVNTCRDMCKAGWFRHTDRSITPDMIPEPVSPPEPEEENLTLAIIRLPPKLREVALLCWFQGMTYSEAAEVLGISFQAVGSRLNRARQKLRSYMEGCEDHESV